jgi:hypothetical protein
MMPDLNEEALRAIRATYSDPPSVRIAKVDGSNEEYSGEEARAVISWLRERGALQISCEMPAVIQ